MALIAEALYTGMLYYGTGGADGELTYQCVVSHDVKLHVLGCTPGVPFNLTEDETKERWNIIISGK